MKAQHIAAAAVLLLSAQLATAAFVDLSKECPGNLLINGGFEEPNTEQRKNQHPDGASDNKWGWYEEIPGKLSSFCPHRSAPAAGAVAALCISAQTRVCKANAPPLELTQRAQCSLRAQHIAVVSLLCTHTRTSSSSPRFTTAINSQLLRRLS